MMAIWIALGATAIAAATDARTGKIPNWLTLPLLPLGLLANFLDGGPRGLLYSLLGGLVCFLVPYVMYWISRGAAIGGGDVKLFGGLGALLGPSVGLEVQLGSFIALLLVAMFTLAWRGVLLRTLANSYWLVANRWLPDTKKRLLEPQALTSMRLGPAIFLSCSLAFYMN